MTDAPLRILHVAHAVPPEGNTGVENYTAAVARAQARQGHTVAVFARGGDSGAPEREQAEDVLTVRVPLGGGHQFTHKRTRWDLADRFRKFVAEWKPDVVHFQHLLYHSLDYPRTAKAAGAGTVLTLHDLWFTCPIVQRVDHRGGLCRRAPGLGCLPCVQGGRRGQVFFRQPLVGKLADTPAGRLLHLAPTADELLDWSANSARCLASVDVLVSPSRFVADDLAANGIAHPNLVVTDYGIPRPTPSIEEMDGPPLRFGVIGTHRLKGVDVAVEAFRRLGTDAPARLLVYGPESFDGLPENATLRGRFAAEDLERVYASFDVLLVPSLWWENAPFVIREAFARGKPVLASDLGGMAESVRDGVDGLRFPVGDADALAACVRRFLDEPDLLPTFQSGIRPPKFFEEHLAELEGLYRQTVAAKAG